MRSNFTHPEDLDNTTIPEWGDPFQYPAGYDEFVSFHPPGSEGWPYRTLAYLRPWPPPGASSSSANYNAAAWPLCNGTYGEDVVRDRQTAYSLSNQYVYRWDGQSRPGPMKRVTAGTHVPKELIKASKIDSRGCQYVDLNSHIASDKENVKPLINITASNITYVANFSPRTLSDLTTVPPCKWMELVHPRYPWKILVTAKVPSQGCLAGVTIDDVFSAVAENLRKDVSSIEVFSHPGAEDALNRHRLAMIQPGYGRLKRMHWLGTRSVQFLGITPDVRDPDKWHMHFGHDDLPERPLPPLPHEDPPEYEVSSSIPSFIVFGGPNAQYRYRAILEPYPYVPPSEHTSSQGRGRKHRSRTSISRNHVTSW